ncbi:MAG: hypothetical protein C0179_04430 [Fervidicoccus sp.]|nr:MAG: hypothetical protein C0179_04430 [Fervidicoccus sp.]
MSVEGKTKRKLDKYIDAIKEIIKEKMKPGDRLVDVSYVELMIRLDVGHSTALASLKAICMMLGEKYDRGTCFFDVSKILGEEHR